MDFPDGCLQEVGVETLCDSILEVVNQVESQVLLSFGPDGLSGHPDHVAIGQAAAEVFRRAGQVAALYTVAVPRSLADGLGMRQVRAVPDEDIALGVDVSAVWEAKLAAMGCHTTQWSTSPMMRAPEERRRLFFGREHFVRAAARPTPGDFMLELLKDWLL
jgi:LmbE family N-acetylglucosaminyl deacetylase